MMKKRYLFTQARSAQVLAPATLAMVAGGAQEAAAPVVVGDSRPDKIRDTHLD